MGLNFYREITVSEAFELYLQDEMYLVMPFESYIEPDFIKFLKSKGIIVKYE